MKKVVIVGNGMVGYRLCARLRERASVEALWASEGVSARG